MIRSPIFDINKFETAFEKDHNIGSNGWYFCRATILSHFNVPRGAKRIQFEAYTEPGTNRYKVEFRKDDDQVHGIVRVEDGLDCFDEECWDYLITDTARRIVRLLGGKRKIWYIKVYYWE